MALLQSINILPGVNVLSVLPHLNYKAWFAIAEFVDNAIQSSIDRQKELQAAHKDTYRLTIDIDVYPHEGSITIRDNAAGISANDYARAFRPAEIPPNASGLSEFGMGMKSAACWFSPNWSVTTTALGENVQRAVYFDIDTIVEDRIEELHVIHTHVSAEKHFTEVRLDNIRRFPQGNTIKKIKSHLASIYRIFLRERSLILRINGEALVYEEPEILVAPSYRDPDGPEIEWKKEIEIDLGGNKSAVGFVAIRRTISNQFAGLALFRRKRLILGSYDETYRPKDIFGASNTYAYLRVFGEIHLKGFQVSHTKDGIQWEETEERFLIKLRGELSKDDFPLLQQVREYRSKRDVKTTRKDAATALKTMAARLHGKDVSNPYSEEPQPPALSDTSGQTNPAPTQLPKIADAEQERVEFKMRFRDELWIVSIELSYADENSNWVEISNRPSFTDPEPRQVTIRISMLHPFMAQFPTLDSESFLAVLNVAAAMALAEVAAGERAERHPSAVRRFTNEILRDQLSKPISND
ncbi:ATP-binding protein [Ectothiorhodospiraceae bacterium 2226]|nr:ATP-binding protein [Ectothiorhodospiraceae bacterium 2226]